MPATIGLAIDVPLIAWNSWPGADTDGSDTGLLPASTCMPGAVRSGLITSAAAGFGPRDEKLAIDGALGQRPRAAGAQRHLRLAEPSGRTSSATAVRGCRRMTIGRNALSVYRSSSSVCRCTRSARRRRRACTARALVDRAAAVRRRHSTTLPVTFAGSSLPARHCSLPAAAPSTRPTAPFVPGVTDAPTRVSAAGCATPAEAAEVQRDGATEHPRAGCWRPTDGDPRDGAGAVDRARRRARRCRPTWRRRCRRSVAWSSAATSRLEQVGGELPIE